MADTILSVTTPTQWAWAKERARLAADLREKRGEVGIRELYRELLSNDSGDTHGLVRPKRIQRRGGASFTFRPTGELNRLRDYRAAIDRQDRRAA